MDYRPLTKKININNQDCIACSLYGTEECKKIHTGTITGCADCPMIAAMLNQLFAFEEAYIN